MKDGGPPSWLVGLGLAAKEECGEGEAEAMMVLCVFPYVYLT